MRASSRRGRACQPDRGSAQRRTARGGAAGTVVTVQTAAQAAGTRALMRKAGVTPRAAAAGPGSAVLRSIAGPPARRPVRVAPLARPASPATAASRPLAGQSAGRGAAAASASFRGRRGRR